MKRNTDIMFADPLNNLRQFNLASGMQVADLGAGSGFYSLPAARLVTEKGRVFAVEVQKDLLSRLKNTAKKENLNNIEVIWGNVEKIGGTRLRDDSIDRVIISNILFQIEDQESFSSEVARILRRGGEAMVIDWSDSSGFSPSGHNRLASKESAVSLFEKAGLKFEKDIITGEHHYGIILRKV